MEEDQLITVRFLGLARALVGKDQEQVRLPSGAGVKDLLERLVETHGEELRASLFTVKGTLRPNLQILVDGQDLADLPASQQAGPQGLDTRLNGASQVSLVIFITAIAGGYGQWLHDG